MKHDNSFISRILKGAKFYILQLYCGISFIGTLVTHDVKNTKNVKNTGERVTWTENERL